MDNVFEYENDKLRNSDKKSLDIFEANYSSMPHQAHAT